MDIGADRIRLLDLIEKHLARPSRRFKFDRDIESQFRAEKQNERLGHYVVACAIGLVLFDLFLVVDAYLVPDILKELVIIHLAIVTPLGVLLTILIGKRVVDASHGASFVIVLMLGVTIYVTHASKSPDAVMIAFAIPPIILFSNIALPLPTKYATAISMLSILVALYVLSAAPSFGFGKQTLAVDSVFSVAIYSLLSTFRLEKVERNFFLITLRDNIRAQILTSNNIELQELSDTDGLTGLGNRRYFDAVFAKAWSTSLQSRSAMGVLMIDLDRFKEVNDRYGHLVGDVCLRAVAECMADLVRRGSSAGGRESAYRFGGEEFIVLLDKTTSGMALRVAERIRGAVEALAIPVEAPDATVLKITVSIGVVSGVAGDAFAGRDLLAAADMALYSAKRAGRNRVELGSLSQEPITQAAATAHAAAA